MSSITTKGTLTLAEFGHDPDRDRPTHLFPVGIRRFGRPTSSVRHPRAATIPAALRHSDEEMCVVCLAISAWLHDASDRDREEWFEGHHHESADMHDAGPISIPGLLEISRSGDIVFFLSPNFIRQSILRSRALEEQVKAIE